MARNQNWTAFEGKVEGDEIQLVVCETGWGREGERIVTGTVTKCTRATRHYTMPGSVRDGEIRFGENMRSPREQHGITAIDGQRYQFVVATESTITRLTDPNRALREAADEAVRDIRWGSRRVIDGDKSAAKVLLDELAAATRAVAALHDAL